MNDITKTRHLRAALVAYAAAAPDSEAAAFPSLYEPWRAGETVEPGDRRYYEETGRLYKCISGHTTQADWTPDVTPSLWSVIDQQHAGTLTDPIPAARGMEYVYGLYYADPEDGKLYRCERSGEAGGGTVILQYLPHELVGQYFEVAV